MRPEQKSQLLLGVARSKAKMLEYNVPEEHHIKIKQDPAKLFTISIGLLGDLAAGINNDEVETDLFIELRNNLLFSARFFDAYLQSQMNETLDSYLVLLGSASYYLCDLPGSASVLAKRIEDCSDLGGEGLEDLLLWLLQSDLSKYFDGSEGHFGEYIDGLSKYLLKFFKDGINEDELIDLAIKLRVEVYESGTPRQLLFGDVIVAVLRKKLLNSSWNALPLYSGLPRTKWFDVLQKKSFIKELWPAQHLLGKEDIFKGASAIVQMPTSAGKTKAIELILRSAFLAERTSLAIIVAPFKALCHEIKNNLEKAFLNESTKIDELTDAFQTDFAIAELFGHSQIIVVTPEKLLYVLRHNPELAAYVGLVIFDEGHQFDSGTRGITYELLLTSLSSILPVEAQKILISAVISNAEAVGEWLNGEPTVVEGINLIPTFRSIGFASWLDQLGRIEFVESNDIEQGEFFVPRVIESFNLGNDIKDYIFPKKTEGKEIALFLGLKLVPNGSIAIFCGTKLTATSICEKAADIIEHNVPIPLPKHYCDSIEVKRLHNLHIKNLGDAAPASKSAEYGIFSHHGNTPHGIRLSVEHAMHENLIQFVVCTSTLAQGVNLPIRYLIVASVYQGAEKIKVRDFHNLIGRAGRAGMHTEGSILFSDPKVYDKRWDQSERWRWEIVKELLDPSKSEECASSLLKLIPLKIYNDKNKSQDRRNHTLTWDILSFAEAHINGWDALNEIITQIVGEFGVKGYTFDVVKPQFEFISMTLSAIEGYLFSNGDASGDSLTESEIIGLTERTLAYYLADDESRQQIQKLFKLLADNISMKVTDSTRRQTYGKTLYGVNDAMQIDEWVQLNAEQLISSDAIEDFVELIWPLLYGQIHNNAFRKFNNENVLKSIVMEWTKGVPYYELLNISNKSDCRIGTGIRPRRVKIENIIDICEGGLAFDGSLLIGALNEFINASGHEENDTFQELLKLFQKQIKYGLPTKEAILVYELGFADRVVAQELSKIVTGSSHGKVKKELQKKRTDVESILSEYPSYFANEVYASLF